MKREVFALSSQLNESMSTPEPEPPKVRLYDLIDQQQAIEAILEEAEGECPPELEERFDAIRGSMPEKFDSICRLRQSRIREAEACEAEAKRLLERAASAKRERSSIDKLLMGALVKLDTQKVRTTKFTIYRQSNPPSIRWTKPESELPAEYVRIKREVDLSYAQEVRASGEKLPEGFVVEQGEHLRVR